MNLRLHRIFVRKLEQYKQKTKAKLIKYIMTGLKISLQTT